MHQVLGLGWSHEIPITRNHEARNLELVQPRRGIEGLIMIHGLGQNHRRKLCNLTGVGFDITGMSDVPIEAQIAEELSRRSDIVLDFPKQIHPIRLHSLGF